MKTTIYSLSLIAGLIAAGSTSALADDKEGRKGPRPGPDREAILEKFDADGDGKLNEEERKAAREAAKAKMEERRAEFIAKHDTDGDGKLSEEERKAAMEARKAEMEAKLIERFDEDGSGDLNAEEQAKADKALERMRKARAHRPGPGQGHGPEGRKGPGKRGPEGRKGPGKRGPKGPGKRGPKGDGDGAGN